MEAPEPMLLCVMTVDIGDGRAGVVNIHEGDDCRVLAEAFVRDNMLDSLEVTEALAEHIAANKALAEERFVAAADTSTSRPPSPPGVTGVAAVDVAPVSAPSSGTQLDVAPGVEADGDDRPQEATGPIAVISSVVVSPSGRRIAETEEDAEQEYEALQRQFNAKQHRTIQRTGSFANSTNSLRPRAIAPAPVMPRDGDLAETTSVKPPKSTKAVSTATLERLSAPPKRPQAPPLQTLGAKHSDPATFTRLYNEADKREKKIAAMKVAAQEMEEAQVRAERDKALRPTRTASLPRARTTDGIAVAAGERLYHQGMVGLSRKEARAQQVKEQQASRVEWNCAACGHVNVGTRATCANIVKYGKKMESATALGLAGAQGRGVAQAFIRVCGSARPADFHPSISEHAQRLVRPLHHDAYMALQNELYTAERRRRDEAASNRAAEEMKECVFKPALNPHSMEIVEKKQRKAASVAPTDASSSIAVAGDTASIGADEMRSEYHDGSGGDRLYADAKKRFAQHRANEARPAEWHGCTFKPDIGPNALRPKREESSADFFARLHAQGVRAQVEVEAQERRLATGSGGSGEKGGPHIGLALYQAAVASLEAKRAREAAAAARVAAAANTRHISTGSTRLLLDMRRRALSGIFLLLVRSASMTTEEREAELQAQVDVSEALAGTGEPGGEERYTTGEYAREEEVVGIDELAHLIAAVDAHAGLTPGDGSGSLADGAHVEAMVVDGRVAQAAHTLLHLDTAWPAILDPILAKYVNVALYRLATASDSNSSGDGGEGGVGAHTATLDQFCACLGGVLEEAGGGPHIYLLAKRHREAAGREASSQAASENEVAAPPAPTFRPEINPRSKEMVGRRRELDRDAAAAAGLAPDDGGDGGGGEDGSAYSRLHRMAEEYATRRRAAEVVAAREEILQHPFRPQTLASAAAASRAAAAQSRALTTTSTSGAVTVGVAADGLPSLLVAHVQALRERNADLAARAKRVMQNGEAFRVGAARDDASFVAPIAPTRTRALADPSEIENEEEEGEGEGGDAYTPRYVDAVDDVSRRGSMGSSAPVSFGAVRVREGERRPVAAARGSLPEPGLPTQAASPQHAVRAFDHYGYTPGARSAAGETQGRRPSKSPIRNTGVLVAVDNVPEAASRTRPVKAGMIPALQLNRGAASAASVSARSSVEGSDKLSQFSMKELEDRIERILAVDPAEEAKSARRASSASAVHV